jgi:hypothetical protein
VPISSFFGGIQRFAGQKLGDAQRAYQQLDKSAGGWLPGGGVASPLTGYVQGRPDFKKPERRTLEGDIAKSLNAAASFVASTRPAVKKTVQNSPDLVRGALSTGLNQLPASVNLFGRYYTGLGDKGLEFSKQYKDKLFGAVKEESELMPYVLEQLKGFEKMEPTLPEGATQADKNVFYKQINDTLANIRSDRKRIEKGDIQFSPRAGMDTDVDSLGGYGTSLGAAWFSKTPEGGYKTDETYDFVYAGADKKHPVPHGPYPGALQPPTPSENMAYIAAESILGRQPKGVTGKGASSPESVFGRSIVSKMNPDPFKYTLQLNRP